MATIKSTEAPVVEAVSNAEDVLKESVEPQNEVVVPQTDEPTEVSADAVAPSEPEPATEESAGEPVEETVAESDIASMSKQELVEYLQQLLVENPAQNIRKEVEQIKVAFYKQHRAEMDALRKEQEGQQEEQSAHELDPLEVRLKELFKIYRDKRDEFAAVSEKAKEENYKAKLEIIEELKSLISSEETLGNTFARFRDLQARWKAAGPVPQPYVKDLWETYNLHVENFYDFVKINKELRDLDLKKNLEAKSALCEQAEQLTAEESVVEAFHKLQKLHDEWRETGPVASEYKDALWERFKAASSIVNRRHQDYFENIKEEQVRNLEAKSALCEKVEQMIAEAPTTHKAWNKANEQLLALQREWRTIGFAPKKDNTKIYDRFRAACDKFFEQKRAFYSEIKDDMEQNLRLKERLCEAAEQLQDSEEWKEATEKLLALQQEWKKIGSVSRRHADAVWKRFRAACDKFFERKSAHFAQIESAYEENLARKKALIEEMIEVDIKQGGYDLIKEFQRRWSEIGYVPIKYKEELQKSYKEAVDRLFGVLRGIDREQSMDRFKDKVSSLRQAGEKRLRSEREKLYNRVKQLEQEIGVLENNIGFFAKSKGAEQLIAEVQEKIAKAKRDMADAIAKVKLIDGE